MIAGGLAALVTLAFVTAHVLTGTSIAGAVGWVLTILLGVLAPGTAIVRATRARRGPLEEDLAWGAVTGLVLTLVSWLLGHLVGVPLPQVAVGLVVTGVLCIPPGLRRRVLAPPATSWGPSVHLCVAAAGLFALRVAHVTGLTWVRPEVSTGRPILAHDLWFHLALTGELRRSLVPDYPMVAGTPLNYHWFYYAVAAQLGGDGSRDLDVVLRLLPTTLLLFLVLLAATVGRVVVGRRAAAAGAAVMMAVVGPVGGAVWSDSHRYSYPAVGDAAILSPLRSYWQWSPTQTLAWVFGLASLGLLIAFIRLEKEDRDNPLWLLLPVLLAAAGSKSVQNVILAGGLGMIGFVLLWRLLRQGRFALAPVRRALGAGVGLVLVSVLVARWLYPESYGMKLSPGGVLGELVRPLMPGLVTRGAEGLTSPPVARLTALLLYVGPVLLTFVGVLRLFLERRTRIAAAGAVGIAVAGLAGLLLFTHPGRSEIFFLVGGAPLVAALSGAGLGVAVIDWLRGGDGVVRRSLPLLAVALTAAAWTVAATLLAGEDNPRQTWRRDLGRIPRAADVSAAEQSWAWVSPWLGVVLGILVAVLAGVVVTAVVRSRGERRLARCALAGLCVAVAASGAVGSVGLVAPGGGPYPQEMRDRTMAEQRKAHLVPVTPALATAGAWLRGHSEPDDIIATNRVFQVPRRADGSGGDNRDFSVSALSGRRSLVAGFGYADHSAQVASETGIPSSQVPFWDPARLAAEQRLITDPSAAQLAAAYRQGVRWILADERSGSIAASLAVLTDPVFARSGVHVYRLRAPV